ncbi:ATP-dependent helicase, partial [candidate division WOR-3 bacterium]|nr:ATP-dependent helicase [candidate division WOR-3 bacterium]
PDCAYIRIEQNYRSSPDILDFTNSVISQAQIGYRKRLFSKNKRKGKPEVRGFYDQTSEASFIVDKILELREAGVPTDQMAVLYRATFHGTFIQAELLKRSIPYVVYGGIRFTERRHVKDMIAYLRIILNPLDAVCWNRVLKLIPGIGSVTASKIVRHVREHGGKFEFADFERSKYGVDLVELGDALGRAADPHLTVASKIELLRAYYAPVLAQIEADHEVRLRDVGVLYELASRYEDLERFLSDFALDPPSNQFQDRTTPRIDESEDAPVALSTVHSVKGLEWNTVFVVHLLDGLFPTDKAVGNIEELEEERSLRGLDQGQGPAVHNLPLVRAVMGVVLYDAITLFS